MEGNVSLCDLSRTDSFDGFHGPLPIAGGGLFFCPFSRVRDQATGWAWYFHVKSSRIAGEAREGPLTGLLGSPRGIRRRGLSKAHSGALGAGFLFEVVKEG